VTVVLLSGGSGGAKLARGLYDVVGPELTVIGNTGDDIEIYDAHVSPDPDLITYWLADRIDDRGWGIAGDTFTAMDARRAAGEDVWFNLGDEDLAVCRERRRLLEAGAPPSEALARLTRSLGVTARVVPMCEEPVRTEIATGGRWTPLQEFLIRARGAAPIEDVRFVGTDRATVAPAARAALAAAAATAIVIGPSNPIISIGPILAVPGMREAIAAARAPCVAVSPIVGGQVLKGPTAAFLAWAGLTADSAGVAAGYGGLIDGFVADERVAGVPTLETGTLMDSRAARRRLAEETLSFAAGLAE
jgi:LPPG:FO 2-phospho-L-lactate transferase